MEGLETNAVRLLPWVPAWFTARYGQTRTLERYSGAWAHLTDYLAARKITSVDGIDRQILYDYLIHRASVHRNTAAWELRVLGIVLQECVQRGLLKANPAVKLRIKVMPPTNLKPEIPAAMLDEIAAAIEQHKCKRQEFFRVSFTLARWHGMRLSETRFPLSCVDFEANLLHLTQKGSRPHTIPLHERVRPLLLELLNRGSTWTYTVPAYASLGSGLWRGFFKRHGFAARLPGITFHSLRVSVATQLARANIPENKAQRYLGHASTTIHRQYLRFQHRDLAEVGAILK